MSEAKKSRIKEMVRVVWRADSKMPERHLIGILKEMRF